MNYYFCFFHIHNSKHTNYHHVIIKAESSMEIMDVVSESYRYELINVDQITNLSDNQLEDEVYKRLIMDGESLLKRIKKHKTNLFKSKNLKISLP